MGMASPHDLRLGDVETFLAVLRLGSIHGAARAVGVSASQVSKAVGRLEHHFGKRLLVRSERGIEPSDAGRALAPRCEELMARARALHSHETTSPAELTIAASAFMNALFLPAIVEALPTHRVRSLEMPPGVAGAYASAPFFDLALTATAEHWPESWIKTRVGMLRQGLFGSPRLAATLGPQPLAVERVRAAKFIVPIYNYRGQVMSGDDGCPLPVAERQIGHETQTLASALALAQRTDQLVFAPELAVAVLVAAGALVEIAVEGWDVFEALQLVCHGERVSTFVQRALVRALRATLGSSSTAAPATAKKQRLRSN